MSVFPDRYIATFEDALGRTVQVKLQKSGYGGLATNFKLADQPLRRVDGRAGSDELEPMRPSVVTVNVATKSESVLDDVYSDNTPWRIEVRKNNFLTFRGPIRKGLRTRQADLGRGGGQITAQCGLGVLQEIPFLEAGSVLTERKSILAWWLWILNKLELDLELYAAVQTYAHAMDQDLPPIVQEYVDPSIYYDDAGEPWSCYDVLRDLVAGKNAFIHQRRGIWHVVQRRLYYGGGNITYRAFAHNWNGTPAGGAPQIRASTVVVPQPSWSRRLSGSQMPTRQAAGSVEISYEHGPIGNMVPELDDVGANGWDYKSAVQTVMPLLSDSKDEVQEISAARLTVQKEARTNPPTAELYTRLMHGGRVDTKKSVRLEAGAGTSINIDAEVLIPLHESVREQDFVTGGFELYFQIRVKVGSTHYYLQNDVIAGQLRETASWVTQESFFRFYWRLTGDLLTNVHFRTPPVPGDCEVFVSLCSALDRLANHPAVRAPYVYWSKVRILPLVEGVDVEAGRTRIIAAEAGSKEGTHVISMRHGTGPTSVHKAATTSAAGGMLNDWKQGAYGVGDPASGLVAGQVQAQEAMYQLRRGRDVLRWTYTRFVDVSPIVAVDEGGRQFLPVFMDEDEYFCKRQVEAVEIRQDGFVPDYSQVTDERGGTFRQGIDQGVGTLIQSMQDGRGSLLELSEITRLARDVGPGRVDSLPIAPALETGLEVTRQGKVIIVAPLYGGRPVQFTMRANSPAGAEWLNVEPQLLEDVVLPAGSIVAASPRSLVSIVTQTAHSFGVFLEGTRVGVVGSDVNGVVDTLPVKHLSTDLRQGTDLIVVPRSGTDEEGQRVQLREAADREDAEILIVPTRLNVKEDDYLVPDLTQYTSEFYVSPFQVLASVEEERKEQGFTRLTAPVVASNVTELQVLATPDDAHDGSEFLVKNVRTGHVVKITLDGDHVAGSEILTINPADFSIAGGWAFLPGSPVVISQHQLRSEFNLIAGQINILTEAVGGGGTSLSELILRVDDLEADFDLHADVITANGLTLSSNVSARVGVVEGIASSHTTQIATLGNDLDDLDDQVFGAAGLSSAVTMVENDVATINATSVLKAQVSAGQITKLAYVAVNASVAGGSALTLNGDYINLTANTGGIIQGNYVAGVSGLMLDLSTGDAEFNDVTVRGSINGLTKSQLGFIGGYGTLSVQDVLIEAVDEFNLWQTDPAGSMVLSAAGGIFITSAYTRVSGTVLEIDGVEFDLTGPSSGEVICYSGGKAVFGSLPSHSHSIGDITGTIDADTLDGINASSFVRTTGSQSIGGTKTFTVQPLLNTGGTPVELWHANNTPGIPRRNVAEAISGKFEFTGGITLHGSVTAGTPTISFGAFQTTGTSGLSFFSGTFPTTKKTVTGSKGGNAALDSLLAALEAYNLITDSTT